MCPDTTCREVRVATIILLLALSGSAFAQALPQALQSRLATMAPAQRAELQRRQALLLAMTPAARAAFRQRAGAWDRLPVDERARRREAWTTWQALPPHERAVAEAGAAGFSALPPERRQALRAAFDSLDASERRGWRLGPVLGNDYPHLHALLAQVPPEQRDRLLATLRGMSPGERSDLAVLALRTPPQERDALRRALVSTSARNRSAWLQGQLDR